MPWKPAPGRTLRVFDGRRLPGGRPWAVALVVLAVTLVVPTIGLVVVDGVARAALRDRTEQSAAVDGGVIGREIDAAWQRRVHLVDALATDPVVARAVDPGLAEPDAARIAALRLPPAARRALAAAGTRQMLELAVHAGSLCAFRLTAASGASVGATGPGCGPAPPGSTRTVAPGMQITVADGRAEIRTTTRLRLADGTPVTVEALSPAPTLAAPTPAARFQTNLIAAGVVVASTHAPSVGIRVVAPQLLGLVAAHRAGALDNFSPHLDEAVVGSYEPIAGTPFGLAVTVSATVAYASNSHLHDLLLAGWAGLLGLALLGGGVVVLVMRRTQRAATVAEDAYRQLADVSPEGVLVCDAGGVVRYANPAAASILGLTNPSLLVGRPVPVGASADASARPPWHAAVMRGAQIFASVERLRHADGTPVWIEVNSVPIDVAGQRAVLSVFRDTTDQRNAAQALADAEAVNRTTLETIAEGVVLYEVAADATMRPVLANPAAGEILGTALGALTAWRDGRARVFASDGSPLAPEDLPAVVTARTGRAVESFVWGFAPDDGSGVRWIRSTSRPVRADDGALTSVVCSIVDVTAAHDRERERVLEIDRLTHRATHDILTELPNRRLLLERIGAMAGRPGRPQRYAVLYIDLDHFKEVNDSLGHGAGDELLRRVAAILRATVRPNDTIARLGGDEFVLLAPGLSQLDDAAILAERVRVRLKAAAELVGTEVRVSASIGIAVSTGSESAESVLEAADNALYMAKERGGNCWAHAGDDRVLTLPTP
jgi:diguanylate cyclase (GGDEF)-like protein/PAS domain S-box-containing protein